MARSSRSLGLSLAVSGWLLIVLQIAAGITLASTYKPKIAEAHASASGHGILGSFHYYASGAAMLLLAFGCLLMLWNGEYRKEQRWGWWCTLGGFLLSLGFQITGNLLPMSSHDVRTANVEASIVGAIPAIGNTLREMVLGGQGFSQATLDTWYAIHRFVLPSIAGVLFVLLVARETRRPSWIISLVPVAIVFAGVALGSHPIGPPATEEDFVSSGAQPMWYVAPMHVLLLSAQKVHAHAGWVGAVLLPLIVVAFLMSLPLLSKPSEKSSPAMRGAIVLSIVGLIALTAWTQPRIQNPFANEQVTRSKETPAAEIDLQLAKTGRNEFVAAKCMDCHKVGSEGEALIGPNLGTIGKRNLTPAHFVELLKDPPSKGMNTMPSFTDLPDAKLRAIAEYLRSLR